MSRAGLGRDPTPSTPFFSFPRQYGFGQSELFIRDFAAAASARPVIATKFAPLPWRGRAASVEAALEASLARLGVARVGLYQLHWPGVLGQTEAHVQGLATCLDRGLTVAGGVSNFKPARVTAASRALAARGHALASNQIQFSLLYNTPAVRDAVAATKDAGGAVIAYSPLAQGLLTGKFSATNLPTTGPRVATITAGRVAEVAPLLDVMRRVGAGKGKTPGEEREAWVEADARAHPLSSSRPSHHPTSISQPKSRSTGACARGRCPFRAPRTRGRPLKPRARSGGAWTPGRWRSWMGSVPRFRRGWGFRPRRGEREGERETKGGWGCGGGLWSPGARRPAAAL